MDWQIDPEDREFNLNVDTTGAEMIFLEDDTANGNMNRVYRERYNDRPIELAQREYEIDNDPHQEKEPVTGNTAPRRNEITSTLDPSNIIELDATGGGGARNAHPS